MSRSTARQHAFRIVFQFPFHHPLTREQLDIASENYLSDQYDDDDDAPENAVLDILEPLEHSEMEYYIDVITGIHLQMDNLDAIIRPFLKGWTLDRLAMVDLALLRLSLYEIKYAKEPIPLGASINEAVELSKLYGTDESPAFINGILGQVVRSGAASRDTECSDD